MMILSRFVLPIMKSAIYNDHFCNESDHIKKINPFTVNLQSINDNKY